MKYIQYYNENGREACGDRAVIIVDARKRDDHQFAAMQGNKRGFTYYSFNGGPTFTRSRRLSAIFPCNPTI